MIRRFRHWLGETIRRYFVAGVVFFGWYFWASQVSLSSGTLTTAR